MGACLTEHTELLSTSTVCFMVYESYANMNTSRRENIQGKKRKWEEWAVTQQTGPNATSYGVSADPTGA